MNPHRESQRGFSLIELLIVVTIILIIAAIAIPNLMRSKIQANEAAAVETLKTLETIVVMYSTTYGGFPHSLADLGPASGSATPTSAAADLIDVVLASGVKTGYKFTYKVGSTDSAGYVLSYSVTATPATLGTKGQRSFYLDGSGTVRATTTGTADYASARLGKRCGLMLLCW